MNNLTEYILKARPDSAESSIKAYTRILQKFLKHPNFIGENDNETWIEDTEWIDKYIDGQEFTNSTRRNYYVALMIYCEGLNGGKYSQKWQELPEYLHFKNNADTLNDILKQNKGTTEKQAENMPSGDEIQELLKKMKPKIKEYRAGLDWSSKTMPKDENNMFMAYVLINIYLELEVRNEIATLTLLGKREYNKMKEPNENFIILEKGKTNIIRHKYKTANAKSSGGTKINELSPNLKTIINQWIKYRNIQKGQKLFPDLQPNEEAKTSTAELNLTKFLQRYFEKNLGKKVSTTLMAKMNIQEKIGKEAIETINKISKTRGTSQTTITTTYGT